MIPYLIRLRTLPRDSEEYNTCLKEMYKRGWNHRNKNELIRIYGFCFIEAEKICNDLYILEMHELNKICKIATRLKEDGVHYKNEELWTKQYRKEYGYDYFQTDKVISELTKLFMK